VALVALASTLFVATLFAHVLESRFEPDVALRLATLLVALFVTNLVSAVLRHASLLWGLPKIETHAIIPLQATQQVFSD
jgi:hypothetical protein